MRRITEDERTLFLAALSGRLPRPRAKPKNTPAKVHKLVAKAAEKKVVERPSRGLRLATPEEQELFLAVIADRAPVKPSHSKAKAPPPPPTPKPPKPAGGLDGNTLRKLTRGELPPTAKLDLHGMTEAAAHGALTAFVLSAHRRGDRLVLVVTGKGSAGAKTASGVLKQMVPRWLDEAPMVKIIAEKRWAHRRHGGEGALYVYLRKR
jgi:DNA-nicking Smr family endonuclease